MTDHQQIEQWLAIYSDLDAATQQQVDAHLANCTTCTATLHNYQQMDRRMDLLMASRLQSAKRRPVQLPHPLTVAAQGSRWSTGVAWFLYRTNAIRHQWQPVVGSALLVALVVAFFYSYIPLLVHYEVSAPVTIAQTPESPTIAEARQGIVASLRAELIARHSNSYNAASFIDAEADAVWRSQARRGLFLPQEQWRGIWVDAEITEIELLAPDLALVRLAIQNAWTKREIGRVYRNIQGRWYWTEPPAELWGEERVLETEHLRFEYRERDAEIVVQLADELERFYVKLHQMLDVRLDIRPSALSPDVGRKIKLRITPQEIANFRQASLGEFEVSSPGLMSLSLQGASSPTEQHKLIMGALLAEIVISKLQSEQIEALPAWREVMAALSQRMLTQGLIEPPQEDEQQERVWTANLLAISYPFSLDTFVTTSFVDREQPAPVEPFVAYIEAVYGYDQIVTLLKTLITEPMVDPEVVIPAVFDISLTELEADWNAWVLEEYPSLQAALDTRQAIEESLAMESEAFANRDATALEQLLDPAADPNWLGKSRRWIQSAVATPTYSERELELVGLEVRDDLARVRIRTEQPNSTASPLMEGRMYRWGGKQWLQTAPTEFSGESQIAIETEHFRITFGESDTVAVLQAAPALEIAYQRIVKLLELPRARTPDLYSFLNGRFEIQVTSQEIDSRPSQAPVLKVLSPAFQSWSQGDDDGSAVAYMVMARLVWPMLEEMNVGENIWRWGVLSSGINQWLLDENVPNAPWRDPLYHQVELQRFFDEYYPLSINELQNLHDGRISFVVSRLLMNHIVDEYGREYVAPFIRGLGEYNSWDELIPTVFNVDVATFEAGWNDYLAENYQAEAKQ